MFFQVLFHALISTNTWHTTLEFAALLVLPALGGVISERSGVVNIAMEGMMLAGAFASVMITLAAHNAGINNVSSILLGVLAAMLAGGVMAMIHALVSVNFKADQIVSGIAINIIALGLTSYLVFVLTPAGQGVPSFTSSCAPLWTTREYPFPGVCSLSAEYHLLHCLTDSDWRSILPFPYKRWSTYSSGG